MDRVLYGSGKYTYELEDPWAKLPSGINFIDICGLSVDSQDRLYVLTRSDHPVMVFDREGNFVKSWGEEFFKHAHGSCNSPDGFVYCADDGHHVVGKFTADGKLLMVLGNMDNPSDTGYSRQVGTDASLATIKRGGPPFNRPTNVALSRSGEIYVTDGYGNARVHKFSPDGKLLLSWGEPGVGPGQFRLPHGVWIDKKERVWVIDRENHRIQIFDTQGRFLSQLTGFSRPTGIYMDGNGAVYISELNQRVSIISEDGAVLARWGSQGEDRRTGLFVSPHAVAVDSKGDIYIGEVCMTTSKIDRGARTVQKFARRR